MTRNPLTLSRLAEVPPRPEPPSDLRRFAGWLGRELRPSAFARSWRPRLVAALLLVGAALLALFGGALAAWQQAALWGAWLVVLAAATRGAWLRLFGPVLFYDLVRTARQGRTFLMRAAYGLALLAVLAFVYAGAAGRHDRLGALFGATHVGIEDMADFAGRFFLTFLGVQFGAVFLLTPAFTAPAIAEEKEKRTLEYLLATDLRGREIVLGKLLSRLLALMLLLLGALPVLSFMQLLGGVDPNLVLAGFAATAMTMLSLGSLGVLNSVHASKPRGAVFSTYVMAGAYLLLTSCCGGAVTGPGGLDPWGWPAAGNVFVAYARVRHLAASAGGTTGLGVLDVLRDYAVFHALATVVLAGLATLKLRSWNREARPHSERAAVPARRRRGESAPRALLLRLPRVSGDPILWKELYAEAGYRLHPLARGLLVFLGGSALVLAGLAYLCGVGLSMAFHEPGAFANVWVRVVGTAVGCLMVVAVAVRASTSLGGERDRQTLDSLLTTPLSNRDILWGKWAGSVLSVRHAWWALGAVWLLGFLAGGLHLLSLLMLLAAWGAFTAFAASVGLWFSLRCRTALRATVWTLLGLLAAAALPVLLAGCAAPLTALARGVFPDERVGLIDLTALTPPGAMVHLAFGWGHWGSFPEEMKVSLLPFALAWAAVCAYALAAAALWAIIKARFGPITGRMP